MLGELGRHVGSFDCAAEESGEASEYLGRRLRRRDDAIEDVRFVVANPGLAERGHSRQRCDSRARGGDKPAQRAGFELRHDGGVISPYRRDMIAHQRVDRRRGTSIGHVGHADVGRALEYLDGDVQRGAGSAARKREFARFGARRGDQIAERAIRRGTEDHEHHGRRGEIANWLETCRWIVARSLERRIDHKRICHQQNRVPVGRGTLDRLGADHRAGAGTIFNHHRRSLRASDLLRHQAREDVGTATGRIGNDDLDRSRLRPCARRKACQQENGRERDRRSLAEICSV